MVARMVASALFLQNLPKLLFPCAFVPKAFSRSYTTYQTEMLNTIYYCNILYTVSTYLCLWYDVDFTFLENVPYMIYSIDVAHRTRYLLLTSATCHDNSFTIIIYNLETLVITSKVLSVLKIVSQPIPFNTVLSFYPFDLIQ